MSNLPTIGGVVTRGEVFSKLLHHLDETQDMCATMAHLHRTEDTEQDRLLAHGWLGMAELIKRMRFQIVELAKRRMQ